MFISYFKMFLKAILVFISQVIINNAFAQQNNSTFINDGSVKYFYDSKLQVLNNMDSMNAAYYRVINYRDGKIDGTVTDYYKSGNKMATGYYTGDKAIKGNENGNFTWYYENGKIFQSCNYINGLLDGVYLEYYPTGKKRFSVNYSLGKKYGCEFAWDENGKITRRAFNENGVAYNRIECDTAFNVPVKTPDSQNKSSFVDHYDNEFSDGDYKVFDNTLYYKSNNLEVISFSVNDADRNLISNAKSKVGYPIFLKITIKGLTVKGGKTKFTLSKYEEDTNGILVSTQTEKEEGGNNPTISIAGGVRMFPNNNMKSMTVHLSFSIKDRNSDSIIHGFFDYSAVK